MRIIITVKEFLKELADKRDLFNLKPCEILMVNRVVLLENRCLELLIAAKECLNEENYSKCYKTFNFFSKNVVILNKILSKITMFKDFLMEIYKVKT